MLCRFLALTCNSDPLKAAKMVKALNQHLTWVYKSLCLCQLRRRRHMLKKNNKLWELSQVPHIRLTWNQFILNILSSCSWQCRWWRLQVMLYSHCPLVGGQSQVWSANLTITFSNMGPLYSLMFVQALGQIFFYQWLWFLLLGRYYDTWLHQSTTFCSLIAETFTIKC